MNKKSKILLPLLCSCVLFVGCESNDDDDDSSSSSVSSTTSSDTTSSSVSTASSSSVSLALIKPESVIREGFILLNENGEALYEDLNAYAQLTVTESSSIVEVHAWGLQPDTQYATHVHSGTCAEGGGPHYLQDATGEDVAENGLWPVITTDAEGYGFGTASQEFAVTEDARSVVIHEPDESGTRIACGDLVFTGGLAGSFTLTEDGSALYDTLDAEGYVSAHSNDWSKAEATATGLSPETTYATHVHVGDCASGGGGHYLQNVEGEDVAENGLWPAIEVNAWGYGMGWATNPFTVRLEETHSMVIHQPEEGTRIACADLDDALLAYRSGNFTMTESGEAFYGDIAGRAKLYVTEDGWSMVNIYLTGLDADTEYAAHVHRGACETGGGGHYLQDLAGEDVAENGLWPVFTTDAHGAGQGSAAQEFTVRPGARSVVVHEPESGDRLVCADLN